MAKSIFKNVIMLLLLIIVILLILGIFFYGILPSNKIVPEKVQYALPDTLQQELNVTLEDEQQQNTLVTYVVKGSDMDKYAATNNYDPGKIDPFADNSGTNNNTTTATESATDTNGTVDSNTQK